MRIFVTLLMSVLCLTGYAQYEPAEKWHHKADLSFRYNYVQSSYRISIQPGFIFASGKSNLRVAPIFQLYSTEAVNDPFRFKWTGFSGIYRLQVPSARKFTELFFKYEGTIQRFKNQWTASIWDKSLNAYQPYKYEAREIFSSHTIGYGFNLNFKQFYIYHTVAAGIYFSGIKGGPISEGAPEIDRVDFRGYDRFGWNYTITLGAGFKFNPAEYDNSTSNR